MSIYGSRFGFKMNRIRRPIVLWSLLSSDEWIALVKLISYQKFHERRKHYFPALKSWFYGRLLVTEEKILQGEGNHTAQRHISIEVSKIYKNFRRTRFVERQHFRYVIKSYTYLMECEKKNKTVHDSFVFFFFPQIKPRERKVRHKQNWENMNCLETECQQHTAI